MYKISQEQLQAIANYLAVKPYNEVVGLIGIISTLEPIKENENIDAVEPIKEKIK